MSVSSPAHGFRAGCLLILAAASLMAHGGGLDALGCHNDRSRGGYHCHRGQLAGRSFGSKSEALAALRDGQSPSSSLAPSRSVPSLGIASYATPPPVTPSTGSTTEMVKIAQNLLMALGYSPGAVDGIVGVGTQEAIRSFQRDHALPIDASVSMSLLVELSSAVRVRTASR